MVALRLDCDIKSVCLHFAVRSTEARARSAPSARGVTGPRDFSTQSKQLKSFLDIFEAGVVDNATGRAGHACDSPRGTLPPESPTTAALGQSSSAADDEQLDPFGGAVGRACYDEDLWVQSPAGKLIKCCAVARRSGFVGVCYNGWEWVPETRIKIEASTAAPTEASTTAPTEPPTQAQEEIVQVCSQEGVWNKRFVAERCGTFAKVYPQVDEWIDEASGRLKRLEPTAEVTESPAAARTADPPIDVLDAAVWGVQTEASTDVQQNNACAGGISYAANPCDHGNCDGMEHVVVAQANFASTCEWARRPCRLMDPETRRHLNAKSRAAGEDVVMLARWAAAGQRRGHVWERACRNHSSSLDVQKSIELLAMELRDAIARQDSGSCVIAYYNIQALLSDFHGYVAEALNDPFANYVILLAVEMLPTEHVAFVAMELAGRAAEFASHPYACRTVLRLVSHCNAPNEDGRNVDKFMDEVLIGADKICNNKYAKYVLKEVLESGPQDHVDKVLKALSKRLPLNANRMYASGLIVTALQRQEETRVAAGIVDKLLRDVESLVGNSHGIFVLKYLARTRQHQAKVRTSLLPMEEVLTTTKAGRQLLQLIRHIRS